jgi:hypothetical protein
MAVVSFRRPEEALGHYKQIVEILQDLVGNPNAKTTIQNLSKEITSAYEISEAKKNEAFHAEEVLAQSKEFLEDFNKARADHELYVKSKGIEIENSHRKLTEREAALEAEKQNIIKLAEKGKKDAADQIAQAQKLLNEAKLRHTKAEELEKLTFGKLQSHKDVVEEFEKDKEAALELIAQKEALHLTNIKKLEEDRKKFEARKQKFEAALKE